MHLAESLFGSGILRQQTCFGPVIRETREEKQGQFQLALLMLKNEITLPAHTLVLPLRRANDEWEDASFLFETERDINH